MNFEYSDLIIGNGRIDLIPYDKEHVPTYHTWLESAEIQELTETEPCTLEEEYQYQEEWEADNQKTKFIKLIRTKDSHLIGDVNLFFQDSGDVEINIMIADLNYRGMGIAKEVLDLLIDHLRKNSSKFERIVAKILSKNVSSIRFFKKYGFIQIEEPNVFGEITMIYPLTTIHENILP